MKYRNLQIHLFSIKYRKYLATICANYEIANSLDFLDLLGDLKTFTGERMRKKFDYSPYKRYKTVIKLSQ